MSMGKPPGRQIAEALMRLAGAGAGAAELASASVQTWREIEAALAPIIGQRGVGALYARSLHLAGSAYPWLAGTTQVLQPTIDVEALRILLSSQPSGDAADASGAVLQTFHSLLVHLIGAPLTEQLLRPIWAHFLSGDTSQDFSS